MTKSERNQIIKWANTLTDEELEKEYYRAVMDTLGSEAEEMYERGCEEAGTKWHNGYWSVQCGYNHDCTPSEHCFQDWGEFETEEEAIKAWNRRAENA